MSESPLVSCIMPTFDRRPFVAGAIRHFLRQDYPSRELVILDDGTDPIADLVPADPRIRYLRLEGRRRLGAKRNLACEEARGDVIVHWDDDDWMASRRLTYQVGELLRRNADVCGLDRLFFLDPAAKRAWLYTYPGQSRSWVAGGTLCYTRAFWQRNPFPGIDIGEDNRFLSRAKPLRLAVLEDHRFYVATVHPRNTSPKRPGRAPWRGVDAAPIRAFQAEDEAAAGPCTNPKMEKEAMSIELPATKSAPTYSIVMVTHNTLETTRVATLRTLRHTAGQSARLIVVDNSSTDGTAEWLRLLARRGDLDLIEAGSNPGHGPGLELGRSRAASPYLVTLDSDAFPLDDSWLEQLRCRLDEGAGAAGILHHRGYIHPSCLMVASGIFDELGVTLLNEKDRPSRLDVAERLSQEILRRGGRLAGLERSGERRRGSRSEPVYLGSAYGGIVYHQWYTTRAALTRQHGVDDVSRADLDRSLAELIAEHQAEPREVTVVMGVRAVPGEPERLRNAHAALAALALQDLPRWKYRLVLVEQDAEPRCQAELAPLADHYLFVRNPGPYNRGWGFNVGVSAAAGDRGALCLIDADLLVPPDFLRRGLAALTAGARAVLPYREIAYLSAEASKTAIARRLAEPAAGLDPSRLPGQRFKGSQGGVLWVDSSLYRELGGHDERFQGWGCEDREFFERLGRATRIVQLAGTLAHLDHPRPEERGARAQANRRLLTSLRRSRPARAANPAGMGNPGLFSAANASELPPAAAPPPGRREWESWHRWAPERIQSIVENERRSPTGSTTRRQLADLLAGLGDSLLDVGCGPGAIWLHLEAHRPRFNWEGLDATPEMVAVARRLFPKVRVQHGDAADLPFAAGAFDLVLLRHVLEHLPPELMARALAEAARVARRAVVVDFFVPPAASGGRETLRVGGFLETRWTEPEILAPVEAAGWRLHTCRSFEGGEGRESLWILAPKAEAELTVPETADGEPFKISIVMPTFRRPHCLPRTIATIQAQTYRNWELILVDNAGDLDLRFDDPRIRLVRHAERPSAAWARNQGLGYATGDLVCFFDDDDDMFPTYLASFAEAFATHPRAQMVRGGMVVSDGKVNYSFATPECCLRRAHASPVWDPNGPAQDQRYFQRIVRSHGWLERRGEIVTLRRPLCRANSDPQGGLRAGNF
jgi:glycosyltransferase involved in cell wall biosynthesis